MAITIRKPNVRVVAVSMMKDEEDVAEAFVRHTLAVADHAVVFDHHSTDRTGSILHRLASDGLPLTVVTDGEFEYRQSARTTALIRAAVAEHGADWVLPLDADEFVQADSPAAFRAMLSARPPAAPHLRLPLVNFGPHPSDNPAEPNPLLRLRHKVRRVETGKVAIPRRLVTAPGFAVGTGNHVVSVNGTELPFDDCASAWLAHVPIRTGWQAALKVAQHETQRAAGGYGAGGTHYGLHFTRLLNDPARFQAEPEQYLWGEVDEPAAYWGAALKYTPPPDADPQRLTRGLLALLARLAESHERWRVRAERAEKGIGARLEATARAFLQRTPRPSVQRFDFLPAAAPDSFFAQHLNGELRVLEARFVGNQLHGVVRVRNSGAAVWRTDAGRGQVNLGVRRFAADGRLLHADWRRIPLPRALAPGDELELPFDCQNSDDEMILGLVAEGMTWFGDRVRLVTPPAPPSAS